ncbi:MAG: enoyl-CoA hydratase/isomerase family protein [Chitinophagaceae bacterium]|nr:enoyl-CoA hydratase/isomerase family protein [Chitinophagaceae bacterium]
MNSQDIAGHVKTETHQSVATIEFYHPQSNSLPAKLLHDLAHAIHDAGIDFNTKAIIIRSAGTKAFCAGASFDELSAIDNPAKGLEFFSGFAHVMNAMRKCPKFIIGRIHGKCVGGGVGLAAAVDYAIALDGADIKLSELSIGFGPFVIAPAVERKIGAAAFSALAIDSAHWRNAEWALRRGLFAELHNTIEALDEAIARIANNLSHSNPEAMTELKQTLWKGTEHWDQLLKERAAVSGKLVQSSFAKTAIAKLKK